MGWGERISGKRVGCDILRREMVGDEMVGGERVGSERLVSEWVGVKGCDGD